MIRLPLTLHFIFCKLVNFLAEINKTLKFFIPIMDDRAVHQVVF